MTTPDIFISYSRDDQAVARQYADALKAEGFSVWWDTELRPGESFDAVIEAALRAAKAVVVLWASRLGSQTVYGMGDAGTRTLGRGGGGKRQEVHPESDFCVRPYPEGHQLPAPGSLR